MAVAFLPGLAATMPLLNAAERQDVSGELKAIVEKSKVPGMAAASVIGGKISAAGCAGVRKAGSDEAVRLADRFHLGSCTKSMTATLAALLVADGAMRWEQTADDSFPGIDIHPDRRGTTLRQLLSNTGACPRDVPADLWEKLWKGDSPEPTQRELLVAGILASAPEKPPGTAYEYSNAGFSIAGAMMEKATGKTYNHLLRELLFKPLGMSTAGFGAPATPADPHQPHGHRLIGGVPTAVPPGPGDDNPAAITPAGRVHASITDFARYAALHLGQSEIPGLTKERLAFLHAPAPSAAGYALGWQVTERPWAGGTALTHNGTNTMFFAVIWLAPSRGFAAVAACNLGGDEGAKACDDAIRLLVDKLPELPGAANEISP